MGKGGDDAELRHRNGRGGGGGTRTGDSDCAEGEASATFELKHDAEKNVLAKLDSQHICVDGIVYALGSFPNEHPGGESIAMFGGSDCTVHYRMIHPYVTQEASCRAPCVALHRLAESARVVYHRTHKNDGSALRRRMEVIGPLEGWQPRYSWGSAFENEVKEKVAAAVPLAQSFGSFSNGFFLRAGLLLAALFALEWQWAMHGSSILLAVLLGIVQAMIGLAVQHDANHGAACRNHRANALLGFGADLIGGSKYLWMQQHWTHHAYTNDHHLDPDASSADPIILFHDYDPKSPCGNPRGWWSPFQHLLLLPVLSFYWITSVLNPQILTLTHASSATKHALTMDNDYFICSRPIAYAIRAFYIFVIMVMPFAHAQPLTAAA